MSNGTNATVSKQTLIDIMRITGDVAIFDYGCVDEDDDANEIEESISKALSDVCRRYSLHDGGSISAADAVEALAILANNAMVEFFSSPEDDEEIEEWDDSVSIAVREACEALDLDIEGDEVDEILCKVLDGD